MGIALGQFGGKDSVLFLELFPAFHCNLFAAPLRCAAKRIFVSIGAMLPQAFFCLDAKETIPKRRDKAYKSQAQKLRRFSFQTANRSSLADRSDSALRSFGFNNLPEAQWASSF
ncbi:hypothetical protein [Flavobacterium caeni]|uniref:hypothetical protein n=1 Tax=Flavobacterium caeni TaxID=490189 RepID=UPI000B89A815|nr:hypothetical protein [Flavobacterium caeni]